MVGFPSPLGGSDDDIFVEEGTFAPEYLPEPGGFLDGHELLTGDDHVTFHSTTREVFDERGVYDVTFGYNLAQLNLDTRHPDAGYRYAVEAGDPSVLRAEFTPTTAFCPQSDTLTRGSFRAWNGPSGRHEYDLVRVRVADSHHSSAEINGTLEELAAEYLETGTVPDADREGPAGNAGGYAGAENEEAGTGPDAPF